MAKKIIALLLAVMMLAALTVSAFADDPAPGPGSIEIKNPQTYPDPDGAETYTAYKIFDVTYDDSDPKNYAYTIAADSPWFGTVAAYAGGSPDEDGVYTDNGLTLTPAPGTNLYSVTVDGTFSAAEFAVALKAASVTDPGVTLANGKATGLDLGYWFVKTSIGALCNLTTTDPKAEIYDKNQPLNDEKIVDDSDQTVTVGQVLTYTATADLPKDVTGYEEFHYVLSDTMTSGLTYRCIESVTIGGTPISAPESVPGVIYHHGGIDPTTGDESMNGFSIDIDFAKKDSTTGELVWGEYLGKTVVITYRAIVNADAIESDVENNTLKLKYSNDPTDDTKYKEIPEKKVDVYSVNIDLMKVSSEDPDEQLEGAEFVLYKLDSGVKKYYLYGKRDGFDDVQWVALPAGTSDVSAALKADPDFCTKRTTGSDGTLDECFNGLDAGAYYLEEIKSPLGFVLPKNPFEVIITKNVDETSGEVTFSATVDGESAGTPDSALTFTPTIANVPGQELPETGGIGTTIFYVLGSVFVLGAVVLLLTKKRV